jgi:hypothetical protein
VKGNKTAPKCCKDLFRLESKQVENIQKHGEHQRHAQVATNKETGLDPSVTDEAIAINSFTCQDDKAQKGRRFLTRIWLGEHSNGQD